MTALSAKLPFTLTPKALKGWAAAEPELGLRMTAAANEGEVSLLEIVPRKVIADLTSISRYFVGFHSRARCVSAIWSWVQRSKSPSSRRAGQAVLSGQLRRREDGCSVMTM